MAWSLVPRRMLVGRKRLKVGLRVWARLQVSLRVWARLPSLIRRRCGRDDHGWRGDSIAGSRVNGPPSRSRRGRLMEVKVGRYGQQGDQ